MSRCQISAKVAGLFCALLVGQAGATVSAIQKDGGDGKVNLVASRVRSTIGPQWVDVEEEAELQVVARTGDAQSFFQLQGKIELPPRSVVVGCLFWRGDTIIQGKLRPHAESHSTYIQIVNDTSEFSKDPLLVELDSTGDYNIRAYPLLTHGSRRIRLRYLVPVLSRAGDVPVQPVFAQVNGELPSDWLLETRGRADSLKLLRNGQAMPVPVPSAQVLSFASSGQVSLVWGANRNPDAPRAVFDRVSGGSWAGDYVLYSGVIPDTVASRAARRSEIVVLWRWVHPETFFETCWKPDPLTDAPLASRCLSAEGRLVIEQAQAIRRLSDRLVARGHRFGLVVDHGLDDTCRAFRMIGRAGQSAVEIRSWLMKVDSAYLDWRIPEALPGQVVSLETSRNRLRFTSDLAEVGRSYSTDSGWLRHLLVSTAGQDVSGADLVQTPDLSGLPQDVSLRSTRFTGSDKIWNDKLSMYVDSGYEKASWPGVDLEQAQTLRPGSDLVLVDKVWIPRSRDTLMGTLLIAGASGDLSVPIQSVRGVDGRWPVYLNALAPSLEHTIRGVLYSEDGSLIGSWTSLPPWAQLAQDSIVPRLWALSQGRISTIPKLVSPHSLGSTFGYVDAAYSLMAIPVDTIGRIRSAALSDSVVPFLGAGDIFARAGYRDGPGMISGRARFTPRRGVPSSLWLGIRKLRIDFDGLTVRQLEVVDVQGRILARLDPHQLEGKHQVDLDLSGQCGRKGLLMVRMSTPVGWKTLPLVLY